MTDHEGELGIQDRMAIEDLLSEFSWRVDHGCAASVAELFVEHGVITTPSFSLRGREQIAAHFARRDAGTVLSRHQWSNLRLRSLGAGRAQAAVIVQTHLGTRTESAPSPPERCVVGDSIEVLEKGADGVWRFAERRLDVVFSTEGASPAARDSAPGRG